MASINTGTGVRSAGAAAARSACARGCCHSAGYVGAGACARLRARWSTGRVCAVSKACSITARQTMRTRARTNPSPAPSRTAAPAGPPCPCWPCCSPACSATSRHAPVSTPARAATTAPPAPAAAAGSPSSRPGTCPRRASAGLTPVSDRTEGGAFTDQSTAAERSAPCSGERSYCFLLKHYFLTQVPTFGAPESNI